MSFYLYFPSETIVSDWVDRGTVHRETVEKAHFRHCEAALAAEAIYF